MRIRQVQAASLLKGEGKGGLVGGDGLGGQVFADPEPSHELQEEGQGQGRYGTPPNPLLEGSPCVFLLTAGGDTEGVDEGPGDLFAKPP